ncbi:MAG TPA: hypothetical protein DF614_04270, partial [Methylococcaceae bacterium]|nr:hypothetical protein [Methylococcaceae bacterium]
DGGDGKDIYQFTLGDSNIGNIDTLIGSFNGSLADKIKLIGTSGIIEILPEQSVSTLSIADINTLLDSTNGTATSKFKGLGYIDVCPITTTSDSKKYLAIDFNQSGQFDPNDLLIDVTNSTFSTSTSTVTGGLTADFISAQRDVATFNGGYLKTNISPFTGISAFTLSFWVNPKSLTNRQDLVGQNDQLEIFISDDNSLQIWIPSIGTIKINNISTIINVNKWNNIVITGDGEQENVYINNQLMGSSSAHSKSIYQQPTGQKVDVFRMGNSVSTSSSYYPLNGAIDDVAIWNSALTATDIANLKNGDSPKSVDSQHLTHYWDFENGSTLDTGTAATAASNLIPTGAITLVGVVY